MSDGVVVGQGGFRVDRKLALEKMAKFQLEDPYRYVLELVAAAVCAGATSIDIENDSDDFVIRWHGALPTRGELEALFDHLFGDPDDLRGQMLQHLAVGALGATGLAPRWLRIDRGPTDDEPAVRLEIVDPSETPVVGLTDDPPDGVRVAVRERLGAATLSEAVQLLFRDPVEARLVQGAARFCPVPISINGRRVPSAIPDHAVRVSSGWLWLGAPAVDLVRHGVVVGHSTLARLDDAPVGGLLYADAVRLNASRSQVVEDARLAEALTALASSYAEWLRHGSFAHTPGRCLAAIDQLGSGPYGALTDLPALVDGRGRAWSIRALTELDPPPGFARENLGHLGPDDPPVFGPHVDRILRLRPDARGFDGVLAARARVAEQQKRRRPAYFAARQFRGEVQHRFVDGPLQGAILAEHAGARGPLVLHLQRDGVLVQTTSGPGPGPGLEVILDHPGFTPNPTWDRVEHDAVRAGAEQVLERELHEFLLHLARTLDPDDAVELVTNCLRFTPSGYQPLPPALAPITGVPIARRGDGERLSVDRLLAGDHAVVEPDGWVPDELLRRCVVIPAPVREVWRRQLGVERTTDWLADLSRARRLAAPRRSPVVIPPPEVRLPVALDRMAGTIGASPTGTGAAELALTRAGVELCTIRASLPLPGVRGAIDLAEDWPVDRAHAAVASEADVLAALAPAIAALGLATWDHTGTPGPAVCEWLRKVGWPPGARERRIGRWGDGEPATLGDALDAPTPVQVSASRPHKWVSAPEVLCVEPFVLAALRHADPRRFVDGTPGVDAWNRHAARFEQQAPLAPVPVVAERTAHVGGRAVWFGLPSDPEAFGVGRIEGVHEGRLLLAWPLGGAGPLARVALEPDRTFTRTREPEVIAAIEAVADEQLRVLVHEATATAAAWFALRARVGPGRVADAIDAKPLVPCLDGVHTLAELAAEPEVVLARGVTPGPAPFARVVLADLVPVGALTAALGATPPDRSDEIRAWREGQARRKLLPPRPLVLTGAAQRRWFEADGLRGEFGLVPGGDGLVAEVVLDGVALEPAPLPFPVPLRAVVTGDALEADYAFVRLAPGSRALEPLVPLAHAYARGLLAAWRPDQPAALGDWLRRYVLAPEVTADGPVFPCADGTWIDRAELDRREALGGVGVARDRRARVPGGPAPVWVEGGWEVALVGRYRTVVVADQPPTFPVPPTTVSVAVPPPRRGEIGIGDGNGVFLRVDGLRGPRIDAGWFTPLDGWVEDPAVAVKPTGDGLVAGPAAEALRGAVRAAAAALTDRLCGSARLDHVHPLRRAIEGSLGSMDEVRAALAAPDTARGRWVVAPAYPDGTGALGSAADVVAHLPVRLVPPGTVDAAPAPGRPRFWALEPATVAWLDRIAATREASREAAEERAGNARRAGPKHPRPLPPAHARAIEVARVSGRVWLGEAGIAVTSDGILVGRLHEGYAAGWLDGPVADVSLSRIDLPPAVARAVDEALLAAWTAEGPHTWPRRFARGVPTLAHRLALPGTPLTLGELRAAAAKGKRVELPEGLVEPMRQLYPTVEVGGRSRSGVKRAARRVVTLARQWGGDAHALAQWGNDPPTWIAEIDRDREEAVAAWGALRDTGVGPEVELNALVALARALRG